MEKKINKIDRITVINAINDKFGTQRECAKALGIDETNLSNKLKRLSSKFIYQLKGVGVNIPNIYPDMILTIIGCAGNCAGNIRTVRTDRAKTQQKRNKQPQKAQ